VKLKREQSGEIRHSHRRKGTVKKNRKKEGSGGRQRQVHTLMVAREK